MNILFFSDIIKFIRESDLYVSTFSRSEIKIENGTTFIPIGSDNTPRKKLSHLKTIHISTMFMLLDMYVDARFPSCVGERFAAKLNIIDSDGSTDKDILHFTYRVLRVLRNSLLHSSSSLTFNNGLVEVSRASAALKMTDGSLIALYSIIFSLIENANKSYYLPVLNHFLTTLKNGFDARAFSDGFANSIPTINGTTFRTFHRDALINPEFKICSDILTIKTYQKHYAIDYKVSIDGKTLYVPEEILLSDGSVGLEEANKWVD